jgi:hypothetical protein
MKKLILIILIFLLVINISKAIDITNCTVIDTNGTYYLINNIINSPNTTCINITTDNVTLNCQNYLIDGINGSSTYGIYINHPLYPVLKNITIKNCQLSNWGDGIHLWGINYSFLQNITANNNLGYGISIIGRNSNLTDITTSNNGGTGIEISGEYNIISNLSLYNNGQNNLRVYSSYYSKFINITSNRSDNLYINIKLDLSNNNNFSDIIIYNGDDGYHLYKSYNNIITNSTIQLSKDAITIWNATNNLFYNNIFNATTNNYYNLEYSSNSWNTTKQLGYRIYGKGFTGGNYWTSPNGNGYSDTCNDTNTDGFCDTPYQLGDNDIDYLPLTSKWDLTLYDINIQPSCIQPNITTLTVNYSTKNPDGLYNFTINYTANGTIVDSVYNSTTYTPTQLTHYDVLITYQSVLNEIKNTTTSFNTHSSCPSQTPPEPASTPINLLKPLIKLIEEPKIQEFEAYLTKPTQLLNLPILHILIILISLYLIYQSFSKPPYSY